jgi:DNA replication protein DnaC
MSSQQTIEQFKSLRLTGMAEAFAHQLGNPAFIDIGFEQRVQMLVEAEWAKRDTQRYERLIKAGKLRVQAAPEDIDYRSSRGLEKAKVADLLTNQWIRHHRNVLLTGATGTGKTWLACAVAVNAARYGISILYQRAAIMLEAMAIAHETGDIEKVRNQYARPQLLILDDFGLVGLIQRHKTDLLELVERRAEGSTIVAGQMPVGKWHEYIGDPAVADAIMDRLVYSSVKIELKGESLRKTRGKPGG